MPVTSEPGSSRGMQEPMDESAPVGQESIDGRLLEDIHQISGNSLGEGAATCQVCGSPLQEGVAVVVYAFRPAGAVRFQLGFVTCGDDQHERQSEYTLGVRELIVEGRVGLCSDGATQSSWPVLLAPDIVGVSAAATKSLRLIATEITEQTCESDPRISSTSQSRYKPHDEPACALWGDGW